MTPGLSVGPRRLVRNEWNRPGFDASDGLFSGARLKKCR